MSLRIEKVNREIRKQIMRILHEEMDDPTIGLLSITKVETTLDLRESKIYFSLLDESKSIRAKEILDRMSNFIRMNLGKRIRMKFLPQLRFIPDDSIKYSVDIYHRIEEIQNTATDDSEEEGGDNE
jgi:ribosome-binding factor A